MSVIGFEGRIGVRLRLEEKKAIKKIVRKNRFKYGDESHFVRCAILKLLREEKENASRTKNKSD